MAFEKRLADIHDAARNKYENGKYESAGSIRVMVHREDIS
jgi:hypothetical protein